MTSDRETYIHRLGRTGRAGNTTGQGLLILLDVEKDFLSQDLFDLDIPRDDYLQGLLNEPAPKHVEDELATVLHETGNGSMKDIAKSAESVYRSLFGFYYGRLSSLGIRSKDPLVKMANSFAAAAGLKTLPTLNEKLVQQFGLKGHPDLNIRTRWSEGSGFDVGRGGGGRGRNDTRGRSPDRNGRSSNRPSGRNQASSGGNSYGRDASFGRGGDADSDWTSGSDSRSPRGFSRPRRESGEGSKQGSRKSRLTEALLGPRR
jgi:ATP-dependent RNA helicase MSS116